MSVVAQENLLVEKSVFTSKSWKEKSVTLLADKTLTVSKKVIVLKETSYLDVTNQAKCILKLKTSSKTFTIKCKDSTQCVFWLLCFRSVGVRIVKEAKAKTSYKGFLHLFEKEDASLREEDDILPYSTFDCKDIKKWTESEVYCFLSFIYVDYGKTLLTVGMGNVMRQSRVNGEALTAVSPRLLVEQHKFQVSHVFALVEEIKRMKSNPSFPFGKYKLVKKLSKNENVTALVSFKNLQEKKILDLYDVDSVMKLIPFDKDMYVTPESSPRGSDSALDDIFTAAPMAIQSEMTIPEILTPTIVVTPMTEPTVPTITISNDERPSRSHQRSRSMFDASTQSSPKSFQGLSSFSCINLHKPTPSSPTNEVSSPRAKKQYQLKVKLVLTELPGIPKIVKNILETPLLNNIKSEVTGNFFGVFHSAIIIGPWYLEWNIQEWCLPKGNKGEKWKSHKAFFVGDIGSVYLSNDEELFDFQQQISSFIVDWNLNYTYRKAGVLSRKANSGNCQDFVQDVLANIQKYYVPKKNKILDEFLYLMKRNGHVIPTFFPTHNFASIFDLPYKKIQFRSHEELDKFCERIIDHCREKKLEFSEDFPGEYLLLKAFDRSFYLRHNSKPNERKYIPYNCCFKDPQQTGSFVQVPSELE